MPDQELRGRVVIEDRGTPTLDKVEKKLGSVKRAFGGLAGGTKDFTTATDRAVSAVARTNRALDEAEKGHRALMRAQHETGITTGRLIAMMIKFGLILQGLRLATAPIRIFGDARESLIEMDAGLRRVNSLLGQQGEQLSDIDARYELLKKSTRAVRMEFGLDAKQVTGGLYQIASVLQTIDIKGFADTRAQALAALNQMVGKMAAATFTDASQAASGLMAVLSAMRIPASESQKVLDLMAQSINVGRMEMGEFTQQVGDFLGPLSALTPSSKKMQFLEETVGIFTNLTNVLSSSEAATATKRMLQFVGDRSAGSIKMGQSLMSRAQAAGGMLDLTARAFSDMGPRAYFKQIIENLGPTSPIFRRMIAQATGMQDEAVSADMMRGMSIKVLSELLGDSKGLVGFLISAQEEGKTLDQVIDLMTKSQGAFNAQSAEGLRAYETRVNRAKQTVLVFAETLQEKLVGDGVLALEGLADAMNKTMSEGGFDELGFGQKLGRMFTRVTNAFKEWYDGGGKNSIAEVAAEMGSGLATMMLAIFGVRLETEASTNGSIWIRAGETVGSNFFKGFMSMFQKALTPQGVGDVLGGTAGRTIGAYIVARRLGLGGVPAGLLALGTGMSAADNGPTHGLSNVLQAVAMASLVGRGIGAGGAAKGRVGSILFGSTMTHADSGLTTRIPGVVPRARGAIGRWGSAAWNRMAGWAMPSGAFGGRYTSARNMDPRGVPGTPPWYGRTRTPNGAPVILDPNGRPFMSGPGPSIYRSPIVTAGREAGNKIDPVARRSMIGTVGGAVGRGIGGGLSAATGIASQVLVFEAISQVLQTIELIVSNWDKFTYALKNNLLGDIPIFGAFFSFLRNIQKAIELWQNAPWNKPEAPKVIPGVTPGTLPQPGPAPRPIPTPRGATSGIGYSGPSITIAKLADTIVVDSPDRARQLAEELARALGNMGNVSAGGMLSR